MKTGLHLPRKANFLAVTAATCFASIALAGNLPGGATTLIETHENWQLNCAEEAAVINCAISQAQFNSETEQKMLTIELQQDDAGGLSGALVLPFGLALSQGITVGVDDQDANAALGFTTCLPIGCIVPIGFDAGSIEALGDANQLNINAIINDSNDPLGLAVSLLGLKSAVARMQEILADSAGRE